ncbi:MAG: Holliday junction branch migration protein RuvA [Armatimonadetes bacterium]|nr:Holliday junction branch migration protein RuvA [Armatimonadota bacterium]
MISYLEGKLLAKSDDRIVVLAGGVGYEIMLPRAVMPALRSRRAGPEGDAIKLHISFHQTERNPTPILIGFLSILEKEFFERLITVEDIGPTAACRALSIEVARIARAIEAKDAKLLCSLDGIGPRKAEKIIASLNGRVGKFALMPEVEGAPASAEEEDFQTEVIDVLVSQLGHTRTEAQRMVQSAVARRPDASTAEELFEEVYRGEKT